MERKNQICKAGQQYSDSMDEFQRYHTYPRNAFIDGAKWADEHPMPEMVNKNEFIDKACAWLEELADGFIIRSKIIDYDCDKRFLVEDFRKSMEK